MTVNAVLNFRTGHAGAFLSDHADKVTDYPFVAARVVVVFRDILAYIDAPFRIVRIGEIVLKKKKNEKFTLSPYLYKARMSA